jgi:hypothetical protein
LNAVEKVAIDLFHDYFYPWSGRCCGAFCRSAYDDSGWRRGPTGMLMTRERKQLAANQPKATLMFSSLGKKLKMIT